MYATALDNLGRGCIFQVSGGVSPITCGDPLLDPLALTASPDGMHLYVVDSLAEDGQGALLVFGTDGTWEDELVTGLQPDLFGGVAATDTSVLFTSIHPGVWAVSTDASVSQALDMGGLLTLPTGIAVSGSTAWVADGASAASSDLFLLSF